MKNTGNLGHVAISAVVLAAFGASIYALLTHAVPSENSALANVLLGTLAALSVAVVNFWLGSSASSARKDQTIADASAALATSTPGPEQKP